MISRTIHHICIQTNQYEESLSFYTDILGFEVVKETKNFHGRDYNTWLRLDAFMIELQTAKVGEHLNKYNSLNEGISHFCICVEDIEDEYQRIRQQGWSSFKSKAGKIIYSVEDGQLFKIIAPEGTIVEIRDKEGI